MINYAFFGLLISTAIEEKDRNRSSDRWSKEIEMDLWKTDTLTIIRYLSGDRSGPSTEIKEAFLLTRFSDFSCSEKLQTLGRKREIETIFLTMKLDWLRRIGYIYTSIQQQSNNILEKKRLRVSENSKDVETSVIFQFGKCSDHQHILLISITHSVRRETRIVFV